MAGQKDRAPEDADRLGKMMIHSLQCGRTINTKFNELKENADNVELLYNIMAHLIHEHLQNVQIHKQYMEELEGVLYILAGALKSDNIDAEALTLTVNFLSSVQAAPIYFQYALLRTGQKISNLDLWDISEACERIDSLMDGEKV